MQSGFLKKLVVWSLFYLGTSNNRTIVVTSGAWVPGFSVFSGTSHDEEDPKKMVLMGNVPRRQGRRPSSSCWTWRRRYLKAHRKTEKRPRWLENFGLLNEKRNRKVVVYFQDIIDIFWFSRGQFWTHSFWRTLGIGRETMISYVLIQLQQWILPPEIIYRLTIVDPYEIMNSGVNNNTDGVTSWV